MTTAVAKEKLQNNTIGSLKWFQHRARTLIINAQVGEDRIWDFSDSCLTWSLAVTELLRQADNESYGASITAPETTLIANFANKIIQRLPGEFDFIDLGPGTKFKQELFFNEIELQKKQIFYIPVDVNAEILASSVTFAHNKNLATLPLQTPFEELPELLLRRQFRFLSLGLTFNNFSWENGLLLLDKIMQGNGSAFIMMQLRERSNMAEIQKIYYAADEYIKNMWRIKLELLGINMEQHVDHFYTTDAVNVYAVLKSIPDSLAAKEMQIGDKIWLFQSRRPTYTEILQHLTDRYDFDIYDDNSTFIAIVLNQHGHHSIVG